MAKAAARKFGRENEAWERAARPLTLEGALEELEAVQKWVAEQVNGLGGRRRTARASERLIELATERLQAATDRVAELRAQRALRPRVRRRSRAPQSGIARDRGGATGGSRSTRARACDT